MTNQDEVTVKQTRAGEQTAHRGLRSSTTRKVTVNREWEVSFGGRVVGFIRYRMITREQRTPGRRYVNSRWQSPGWEYRVNEPGREFWFETDSKKYAVERLLRDARRRG